jgi:hypothetical protein
MEHSTYREIGAERKRLGLASTSEGICSGTKNATPSRTNCAIDRRVQGERSANCVMDVTP